MTSDYKFYYQPQDPEKRIWYFANSKGSIDDIEACISEKYGPLESFENFENNLFTGYHTYCNRPTKDAIKRILSWRDSKAQIDFFHIGDIKGFNENLHWRAKNKKEILHHVTGPTQKAFETTVQSLPIDQVKSFYSDEEFAKVKSHYPKTIPDIVHETIIQTWSEHCSHKVFRGKIILDGKEICLFKDYIKNPSLSLNRKDVLSSFAGNAGIVQVDDETAMAIKMETHNTPSQLEPIHGAATGITGVVRDVMAVSKGAKPVGLWNALYLDSPSSLVIDGVAYGGNQLGLPTIAGNFSFHPSFAVKPLVFCGSVSEFKMPFENVNPTPNSDIVLIGGLTGRDGLHGAVQSSKTDTAQSSIVQYAYPYQQWEVVDFLEEAKTFIEAITDCGAGGLSSAVGEMGNLAGGAKVDLDSVPLRQELLPWEIWCSESQERFVLSTKNFEKIKNLASKYGVPCTKIGTFTDQGNLSIYFKGKEICKMDFKLLFEEQPLPTLKAKKPTPKDPSYFNIPWPKLTSKPSDKEILKTLLQSHYKERHQELISFWDGEVGGKRVQRSYVKTIGSGGSLQIGSKEIGISLGSSGNFCAKDGYRGGLKSFDEAYRNAICLGMDPEKMTALDNFSWINVYENAEKGDEKLGLLTKTCEALKDCVLNYKIPFVSGKDSMMNDRKVFGTMKSVIPTLVTTLVGPVKEKRKTNFEVNDSIYLLPSLYAETAYSELSLHFDGFFDYEEKNIDLSKIIQQHEKVRTQENFMVDVSRGGFLTTLCKQLVFFKMGAKLSVNENFFEEGFAGYLMIGTKDVPKEAILIGKVTAISKIETPNFSLSWEEIL